MERLPETLSYLRILIVALMALIGSNPAWACTFCSSLEAKSSLLTQVQSAETAVFAELIRSPEPQAKKPISQYRIVNVLKGSPSLVGQEFEIELNDQSPLSAIHLFLCAEKSNEWQNPRGCSKQARDFLQLAARLQTVDDDSSLEIRARRLAFMVPHLISKDSQVVQSALAEFAATPNGAVNKLKPVLNPQKLTAWIEFETDKPPVRRLLFLLLGVCGTAEQGPFVKAALEDRLQTNKVTELDAIIATYLTLYGAAGLDDIDRRVIKPTDISIQARRAASNALRFHMDNESAIQRERLIASCRLFLSDPKSADFVIADLARWQDWESLDQILSLWQKEVPANRWLQKPIQTYLNACPLPAARSALASKAESSVKP